MDGIRIVSIVLAVLALCPLEAGAQQGTRSPHGRMGANLDCIACHSAEAWTPVKRPLSFDHNRATTFVLLGRHKQAKCASCHLDLRFDEPQLSTNDCASCHVDVHQGQLGAECTMCHSTLAFNDVNGLSLHTRTSFPLTGAHLQLNCESCHRDDQGGAFTLLDTECISCHQRDLAEATTVDHSGFPDDCRACHGNLTWGGDDTFDHFSASGGFGLLGAHSVLDCSSCHSIPSMDLLFPPPAGQNDCVACHQADYDRQHAATGFPTTCLECHNVDTWEGARFDHITASGGFALLGAHATLECSTCHNLPGMELRFPPPANTNDCIACHQTDYDRQHSGSGFPTACLECHTVNSWEGATFDHSSFFPISSGTHAGTDCVTCHEVAGNYQVFTCFNCHQHSQDRMDSAHSDENGYVYDSNACYSCHPNGRKP